MKKVVAVLLALSLMLTMAFAVAEESTVSTYMMVAAADADGNVVDITTAELPVLVLAIDGASNECAFGTDGEEPMPGTYELVAGEDGVYVLTVALNDGSEAVMFYSEEEDMFWLINEEGISMFLYNLETLAAEADAA